MKCQDCQELFSLYFDGEIDQISRSDVDSHLASCPQCKMEWQAFKNSIDFLRDMPMSSVPQGFLAGIHQKLEPRTPWQKVQEFLAGKGEKKWAWSTAFAMLVIGFVTASLIQLIPVSQTDRDNKNPSATRSGQVAENNAGNGESSLVLAQNEGNKGSQQDFYPGIPLLSEYEGKDSPAMQQFAMIPRSKPEQHIPTVDFVSTGSGHTSSPYLDAPFGSFASQQQIPTIKPDLQITIHSAPRAEQMAIVKQIVQSPLWRAELYDHNTLLLSVPASSYEQLLQICCSEKTSLSPEYARNTRYISLKRFLTVAVKLD
ncbi:MAG: zf-HC2 domain-containing protein [Proteobacteria bacterium]|nr:zf-HC2 domain-containing protein [Pseudomonadota bacterium]MBU4296188.1 zf-HC2 domain-containing protein [Pseudomonadota bacterium]MCG2749650.1 zf-HC2 domain-containing protein [Desulfobulbaceae bacterium]